MLFSDLTLLLFAYFVLLLLQAVALPLLFFVSRHFPHVVDAAWSFGRFVVLLVVSWLVWHLAFLGLPVNTMIGINSIFFVVAGVSWYLAWHFFLREKNFLRAFFARYGKIILIEELVFLVAMVFLFAMRSFQPEILGLEKFMDAGFIQAYLKSPTLPAADIWYAGSSINYYSFGQFYHSVLLQLWQVDLRYGYNLLLIFLFALFCTQLFSIGLNLRMNLWTGVLKKPVAPRLKTGILAGLLTVLLVAVGGNGHTIWHFMKYKNFAGYWYPDATRFIERTIHEFPAYSFVVSDLHAHVLSLPINVLVLFIIFLWFREVLAGKLVTKLKHFRQLLAQQSVIGLSVVIGSLLGTLVMTNTWDILIHGALLVILGLLLLWRDRRFFWHLLVSALLIAAATAALAGFWLWHFTPISSGLALATEHTPLWQLVALWLPHVLWATGLMVLVARFWSKQAKSSLAAVPLLGLALLLLVIFLISFPELFYFKDIYTTYPRANTMFKLVFQGFMFLGLLVALSLTSIPWRRVWWLLPVAATFLYFTVWMYPYHAYRSYYGDWRNYQGLDGLAWFERKYPQDFLLTNYLLKQEPVQVNIVEAVGESYSEFARVSAFSGMPTILGWRVHEWLWRAGWDGPGRRTSEVETIYTKPTSEQAATYLSNYQVRYIVIGSKEKEAYPKLDLKGLLSLGEIVFSSQGTYLIKLKPGNQ